MLPNTITIEMQLRPCKIYEDYASETGVFHKWVTISRNNAHPEIMAVKGIVELSDGNVMLVEPHDIRFTDGLVSKILAEGNYEE